jgi:hypothetical protein
MMEKAPMATLL